jgi:hypothetical protein
MADQTEQLKKWGKAAEDDNDLRTEEGILAYAARYSARNHISLEEALEFVRAQVARRQGNSNPVAARISQTSAKIAQA